MLRRLLAIVLAFGLLSPRSFSSCVRGTSRGTLRNRRLGARCLRLSSLPTRRARKRGPSPSLLPSNGCGPGSQLGQDRGGFYSYDILENLVGCAMPTTDRLLPERQSWQIGDKLWMYPPEKAGGIGFATLRVRVPGRALGLATRAPGTPLTAPEDGSWSFILEPLDALWSAAP
jgi:hypothetical protein